MDVKLQPIVEDFKRKLAAAQIRCVREKDINYGHQVVCAQGTVEGTVNFYYGKKGLSVVVQGKDGALKQTLTALATGERAALPPQLLRAARRGCIRREFPAGWAATNRGRATYSDRWSRRLPDSG